MQPAGMSCSSTAAPPNCVVGGSQHRLMKSSNPCYSVQCSHALQQSSHSSQRWTLADCMGTHIHTEAHGARIRSQKFSLWSFCALGQSSKRNRSVKHRKPQTRVHARACEPQNRPSLPERQTSEGPERQSSSSRGSAYQWAGERDTQRREQPKASQRAMWASALVQRSVWCVAYLAWRAVGCLHGAWPPPVSRMWCVGLSSSAARPGRCVQGPGVPQQSAL